MPATFGNYITGTGAAQYVQISHGPPSRSTYARGWLPEVNPRSEIWNTRTSIGSTIRVKQLKSAYAEFHPLAMGGNRVGQCVATRITFPDASPRLSSSHFGVPAHPAGGRRFAHVFRQLR